MSDPKSATLVQLLVADALALNFTMVVRRAQVALASDRHSIISMQWEDDDIATFDLGRFTLTLALTDELPGRYSLCLTIAASEHASDLRSATARRALCQRLIEALRLDDHQVQSIWHDCDGPVTSDTIDRHVMRLPAVLALRKPAGQVDQLDRLMTRMTDEMHSDDLPAPMNFARPYDTNVDTGPAEGSGTEAQMRTLLHRKPPQPGLPVLSTPMRLAVHAMNTSLMAVAMPLGLALAAASVLRGEDMRLSASIVAVTGAFQAASQTEFGHALLKLV